MALIEEAEEARDDAPARADAIEALHDWHREQQAWLDTSEILEGDCAAPAAARYVDALDETAHGLGLFHHVGLERSYEVLLAGKAQLEATLTLLQAECG